MCRRRKHDLIDFQELKDVTKLNEYTMNVELMKYGFLLHSIDKTLLEVV